MDVWQALKITGDPIINSGYLGEKVPEAISVLRQVAIESSGPELSVEQKWLAELLAGNIVLMAIQLATSIVAASQKKATDKIADDSP